MKSVWKILIAVTLLLVTASTQCSTMDGPETAARNSFSEWAVNIRVPYRHEAFQTLQNDGTVATVRITVELKVKGEWIEKQTEIQCGKDANDWQCDRSVQFQ